MESQRRKWLSIEVAWVDSTTSAHTRRLTKSRDCYSFRRGGFDFFFNNMADDALLVVDSAYVCVKYALHHDEGDVAGCVRVPISAASRPKVSHDKYHFEAWEGAVYVKVVCTPSQEQGVWALDHVFLDFQHDECHQSMLHPRRRPGRRSRDAADEYLQRVGRELCDAPDRKRRRSPEAAPDEHTHKLARMEHRWGSLIRHETAEFELLLRGTMESRAVLHATWEYLGRVTLYAESLEMCLGLKGQ